MTKARWDKLFSTNKLHWALYRNDKLQFHGNTLNSVLVDSIKNNVTQGTFKLRIIDASTLKAAIGNFEIQLDTDLANLKVTPATVEVKAAKDTYTKVYGTEVTKRLRPECKTCICNRTEADCCKIAGRQECN